MHSDKIEYILDNFDWEKVRKVMEVLDWKWSTSASNEMVIPSFSTLRRNAKALLIQVSEGDYDSIKTGGFAACKLPDGHLELRFEIDSIDSADMQSDA